MDITKQTITDALDTVDVSELVISEFVAMVSGELIKAFLQRAADKPINFLCDGVWFPAMDLHAIEAIREHEVSVAYNQPRRADAQERLGEYCGTFGLIPVCLQERILEAVRQLLPDGYKMLFENNGSQSFHLRKHCIK